MRYEIERRGGKVEYVMADGFHETAGVYYRFFKKGEGQYAAHIDVAAFSDVVAIREAPENIAQPTVAVPEEVSTVN